MTEPTSDFGLNRRILVSVPTLQADTCEDRLQLLDDETESVVAVMYDRSADELLQSWRNQIETVPNDAQIVDIEQPIRSMATESTNETSGNGDTVVQTVQRPDDLREIETAIKAALESATGKTTLVFDSLTSLLEHVPLVDIVPFFRNVADHLTDCDATGYFYLERRSHDHSTIATFHAMTDATVELAADGAEWTVQQQGNDAPDTPSIDALFDVLRSRRRREVLRYLLSNRGPVDVTELATAVADVEENDPAPMGNQDRRYHTTLYQLHLSKLDDAGLIDHDASNHRVSIREVTDRVAPFLAIAKE